MITKAEKTKGKPITKLPDGLDDRGLTFRTVWTVDYLEKVYVQHIPKKDSNDNNTDNRYPQGNYARGKVVVTSNNELKFLRIERFNAKTKQQRKQVKLIAHLNEYKLNRIAAKLGYNGRYRCWTNAHDASAIKSKTVKSYILQPYYPKILAKKGSGQYDFDATFAALSQKKKLKLLIRLINDVKRLHQLGYVHGNIKPENLACETDANGNITRLILIDLHDAEMVDRPTAGTARTALFQPSTANKYHQYVKQSLKVRKQQDIFSLAMLVFTACQDNPLSYEALDSWNDKLTENMLALRFDPNIRIDNSPRDRVINNLLIDYSKDQLSDQYTQTQDHPLTVPDADMESFEHNESKNDDHDHQSTCSASGRSERSTGDDSFSSASTNTSPTSLTHQPSSVATMTDSANDIDNTKQTLKNKIQAYIKQNKDSRSRFSLFADHGRNGVIRARALERAINNSEDLDAVVDCLRHFVSQTLPGGPVFGGIGIRKHSLVSYVIDAIKSDGKLKRQINERCSFDMEQFAKGSLTATKDQKRQFIDALQIKETANVPRNLLMY